MTSAQRTPEGTASPHFFPSPAAFRAWLAEHHDSETELWVGFHKKATGRPTMTWPESVAQALCFGWIDGIRKTVDGGSYKIRFTPRKPRSNWSAVNLRMVGELIAAGQMTPAGLAAYEKRDPARPGYSFEQQRDAALSPAHEKRFRADRAAWEFFQAQPPSYRRLNIWRVVSAKKEETRDSRLEKLIAASKAGRRL